jgi:hypothetical protein
MPSQYSIETLPTPNNDAVTLREVVVKRIAVVKYSGLNTQGRIKEETEALVDWTKIRQLIAACPANWHDMNHLGCCPYGDETRFI